MESRLRITFRGWPGHFILGHKCVFHLNTLVEYGDVRVVVSTVGNLRTGRSLHGKEIAETQVTAEMLGSSFHPYYYETKAFYAQWQKGYWEIDPGQEISLPGSTLVTELTEDCDQVAQDIHMEAVKYVAFLCRAQSEGGQR